MSTRVVRWVAAVLAVGVVAVVAVVLAARGGQTCVAPEGMVMPGRCIVAADDRPPAPTTSLPVLGDQSTQLSVEAFSGDIVVVNFWGSWCAPCRTEQPDLNLVAAQYRDQGVSFLGVDVNEFSETNGLAHEAEFAIPYPSLWDPALDYAADFEVIGPQGMPATVIVDRDGRVAASFYGGTNEAEMSALLDMVVAESSAP